ncbi:MAG: hypothetical protein ACI81I_000817 [Arcobacteraceae bacterium]|jgi:hypothetical protein
MLLEPLEINKDNIATDSFLTVLANVLESYNNIISSTENIDSDSLKKILNDTNDAFAQYSLIKNSILDTDLSRLKPLEDKYNVLNDSFTELFNNIENKLNNGELKGNTGSQGLTGTDGLQGVQGIQGLKGDKGVQGDNGVVTFAALSDLEKISLKGDQGNGGIQGLKGNTGDQGTAGIQGDTGNQGLQGIQGNDGLNASGGVLQVVSHLTAIQGSQTVTTIDTIVNDLSKTIVPKGNNSKFLVSVRFFGEVFEAYNICFNIHADSQRINVLNERGYALSMPTLTYYALDNGSTPEILNFTTLYQSSSQIGTPIKFDLVVDATGNYTLWNNRCFAFNSTCEKGTSEIIIMEIGE